MISASRIAAVAFAGVAPFLSVSTASAVGVQLFAILQGGHEIPGPGSVGGSGAAAVTFSGANSTRLCVAIIVNAVSNITAAHIHRGFGSVAGPVAVTLPTPSGAPGLASGCVTITAALSAQIRSNPQGFYVNVHSTALPNGAIRGQLF